MPIEMSKKKEAELDELPEGEDVASKPSLEEEKHRLEIENAEMRGRLSAAKETSSTPVANSHEQTKQVVYRDAGALDDDKFFEVYKMTKSEAKATLTQREAEIARKESKLAFAEAEAKVELATRFGADFYRFKNQIEEGIADLSDDVKADPKRLAKAMERHYLSLQKEGVAPKLKDDQRKKIVSDFERPGATGAVEKKENEEQIPDVYKPFSKVFGIRSEVERKDLMKTIDEGEFVPMNMGNGYWFRHPDRGFERDEPKA